MKQLVIVRGPSGSGKSTRAKQLIQNAVGRLTCHCEADQYFTFGAEYRFDPALLGYAHEFCRMKAEKAMIRRVDLVIVSNTFTKKWEYQPYVDLAIKYGYRVTVETMDWQAVPVQVLADRNRHNVPVDAIKRQIERWEN